MVNSLSVAKVAHRCEETGQPLFVLPHVAGFLPHLCHKNGVGLVIEPIKYGRVQIKLVAQHKNEGVDAQCTGPAR